MTFVDKLKLKVISGGQTGVDRAALDVAIALNLPCGGWCPKDRRSESGPIPAHYPLQETPSAEYEQRTEWNVRDSDGTLILTYLPLMGGTLFTLECAQKLNRPHFIVDLAAAPTPEQILKWTRTNKIAVLNLAGPRAENFPDIYQKSKTFLEKFFSLLK